MPNEQTEFEEIKTAIERVRALLESLVVRGLRACGPDELGQLQSYTDYFERAGAGHIAGLLGTLHQQIEADSRTSAKALLAAQTAVRMLERVLTLRVVNSIYAQAVGAPSGVVDAEAGVVDAEAGEVDADGELDDDNEDGEE